MRTPFRFMAGLLLGVAACRPWPPPPPAAPVPVEGRSHDLHELVGHWSGEFHDDRTARHGTITFALQTGEDTAFAHVELAGAPAGLLRLGRLGVSEGSVGGWLASYRDPDAGCSVDTWFEGELRGDVIAGRYFSDPADGGMLRQGRWELRRIQPD